MPDDIIRFGEPEITVESDGSLKFQWNHNGSPSLGVLVEDTRNDGDKVMSNLTVWWLYDQPLGVRPIQPMTILNMTSSHYTGWRNIAKVLQHDKNAPLPDVDIDAAMTIVTDEVLTRFFKGNPTIELKEMESRKEAPYILEPWVAASGATVMYGAGGLGKSLIALAMGISVSTGVPIFGKVPQVVGPVMFYDYEDDYHTHVDRMHAVCRSFGIPIEQVDIHYHTLVAPVVRSKTEMHKRATEVGAVLGILDSVGMGRGGSAITAEDTIRMFRALREIDIPFLTIDHVSKESIDKKGGQVDAYGSIYTMNSARLAWSLSLQDSNDGDTRIHCINRKANHVRKAPPQTMSIKYHNDERGVPERIDIETGNEFGMMMPTVGARDRVLMLLADGSEWTYADISEQLGIATSNARKIVSDDQTLDDPSFETRKEGRGTWVKRVSHMSSHDDSHVSEEGEEE